jgi:stage III sporulation protein AB
MWISIIGCICITSSTLLFGLLMSLRARMRIVELSELQKVFFFMKNEIVVFNNLFMDIIQKICNMEDLRVRIIFQYIWDELENNREKSLNEAWKKSVQNCSKHLNLSIEDIEVLKSFGMVLERSDINGQLSNINITIEKLRDLEKRAKEFYEKNGKLYRSSGVLAGLAISIMLF